MKPVDGDRKTVSAPQPPPPPPVPVARSAFHEMQQAGKERKEISRPSVEWFVCVQKAAWFTNLTDVAISSLYFFRQYVSASAGGS